MADSPLTGSTGVVSVTILSNGNAIADTVQIVSIEIVYGVNKIPSARIVILDGDMPNNKFPVSDADDFKPGAVITINAGYANQTAPVFKGVVIKHGIKMDGDNFTATIQDPKIQNDLFLDYVQKMIEHNNKNIDTSENIENQNFPPPDFFQYESEIFDIEEELNQIKNNVSKKKEKNKEVTLSLDELLDKINVVGYENLTENEKDTLKMYSQK